MIADLAATARRTVVLLTSLALLALALLAAQQRVAPTEAAAAPTATAMTTSGNHPYSDPSWFPLRRPADIGCAKTACGRYDAHGYWAMDWTGRKGDPIYAAGAGVLHVGGRASGCAPKDGGERDGNWVWIDHGAGVVSRYHHLDRITARDGQLVTPATRIGTMGSTGDNAPCSINYLHFEVRHGGVKGKRVDFGQLRACTSKGAVNLPAAVGGRGWDDPKIHTRPRVKTPSLGSGCLSPSWLHTPNQPSVSVARSSKALTVRWSKPSNGAGTAVIALQVYRPSLGRYAGAQYVTVKAADRHHRIGGLLNGRAYKVAVSLRNGHGNSRASGTRTAVPGAAPRAPKAPRYATWTKRDYVHYGWYRPDGNGHKVTSFTVASRCGSKGTGWSAWRLHHRSAKDAFYNIRGMAGNKYTVCQVKVRAGNAVGQGAWSATTKVRWRG